jgi:CRP-like cAMP-binding protein
MPTLAQVKEAAGRLYSEGNHGAALRLYDAIVAAAPLEISARTRVADCLLALGLVDEAVRVYRAVGWYAIRAGHPLAALVCARVLEAHGQLADDLLATLVVTYGSESEVLGKVAARVASPAASLAVPVPDLQVAVDAQWASAAAARAEHATAGFSQWPSALHPIPLFSALSEAAFRRVLGTAVLHRLPGDSLVIRQGEPGTSFFFVATGEVCVFTTDADPDGAGARSPQLARLHENAIFGEMALLAAQPRSASVRTVGETDLLELGRHSLAAIAEEITAVALALHSFTRDRLLGNLMAKSPLFRPFDGQQQRELLRRFTSHDVAPGTVIIHQGEPGRGLFVVLTGELEVLRRSHDHDAPQSISVLTSGDVFGEIALLRGGETSATVVAIQPSTVLFLGRETVERMIEAFPELHRYLNELAGDREIDNTLMAGIEVDLGDEAELGDAPERRVLL